MALSVGRSIIVSCSRITERVSTRSELDCARSVRNASATVAPSVESLGGEVKSATMSVSRSPKAPCPCSEAIGPMPSARITMKAITSAAKPPTAIPPPSHARRQVRWGEALMASVAMVPCGTTVPGVAVKAR